MDKPATRQDKDQQTGYWPTAQSARKPDEGHRSVMLLPLDVFNSSPCPQSLERLAMVASTSGDAHGSEQRELALTASVASSENKGNRAHILQYEQLPGTSDFL
eukprot:s3372_g9.t1